MGEPVDPAWTVPALGPGGFRPVPAAQLTAAVEAEVAALASRITALEARPEEVARFTATGKVPAVAALASTTLTLTGLVPARAGDVLKAGETVAVCPSAALPAGLSIAAVTVPADGTVAVQLTALVAVAAGKAALTWTIAALR